MKHANPMIGLIDSVSRLQGRLKSAFADARSSTELSDMEMTVLNAVIESSRPPTVPQIGRGLGHPRQVIQRAANALVEAGFIAPKQNPDHKRAALLVATTAGLAVKAEADARGRAIADDVVATVDPELVSRAIRLIDEIREQLEAHARLRKDGAAHG